MTRISVVTVVRNDLAGLLATRDSLRAQRFGGWEWIVVDGASTDGTAAWLAAHADEPAWWRSAPDGGLYDAMNVGLDAARGEHVLFLNAGDTLAGTEVLGRLAAADGDLLYGDALERGADGRLSLKPARSHRFAFYGMFTHHQAMAYRRTTVAGLRFESRYSVGADYAFTLRALERSERVSRLDFPVCVFAPGGVSQRHAAIGRDDQTRVRRELLGTGRLLCAAITATQCCAAAMKRHLPTLYSLGRFRPLDISFRL
ncbi:glycosyltransferase family 2 protein [Azospirillum sp.]|uniref:glycosyltransferase family 2 protein n=1 Tax=Azospirillum sp. TaxID=34012 RepID=UPI003D733339